MGEGWAALGGLASPMHGLDCRTSLRSLLAPYEPRVFTLSPEPTAALGDDRRGSSGEQWPQKAE